MKEHFFSYNFRHYSFPLVAMVLALSALGVYFIGRVAPEYQTRQIFGIGLGIVAMVVLSLLDYQLLVRMGWWIYLAGMLLLLAVNLNGAISGGAARWIEFGGFRFQPSELGKIMFIVFFAWLLDSYQESLDRPRFLLLLTALMGLPVLSVFEQPDLSTSIVITWTFLWMLFIGGLSWKIIVRVLAVAIPGGGLLLFLVTRPDQRILSDYQHRRIMAWLSADARAQELYQQDNSILAIGSGELLGRHGADGAPLSVIENGFLPEPHTDFIMAAVGEELGFVGCALVILLLCLITFQCVRIGLRAASRTGMLICIGMAALLGAQSCVNMGVVSGMLPNTGLTLPFVSYGLTSLVSLYMGIGLVLNVGLHYQRQERGW